MKAIFILIIIVLTSCQKEPEPITDLSCTTWHWFEFNRSTGGQPTNHYLDFKQSGVVDYRSEQNGSVKREDRGRYERIPGHVVLTFEGHSDTLEYNGDKIYVKKSSEGLEFYKQI